MPKFIVELYELHAQKYEIEAANKAEAISGVLEGNGEQIPLGTEYVDEADLYGQSVNNLLFDDPDDAITKFCGENDLGLEDKIWGVRSVEES